MSWFHRFIKKIKKIKPIDIAKVAKDAILNPVGNVVDTEKKAAKKLIDFVKKKKHKNK